MIFIDGNFSTETECKYHCSPTCHPLQVGPEWVYGCTHKAWPANKYGDFVPIVDCGGEMSRCELTKKLIGRYKGGLTQKINNARRKLVKFEKEYNDLQRFIK